MSSSSSTSSVGTATPKIIKIKKNVWIIRHAESEANAQSTLEHLKDKPDKYFANTCLTENGKQQAKKIQGPTQLLVISPLRRTLETYVYARLHASRVETTSLVREYNVYGPNSRFEYESDAVETYDEFNKRMDKFLEWLKNQPEHDITILSHGVFLSDFARRVGKPLHTSMCNAQVIHLGEISL
jgi:broad specificity phosphatase PhoE